MKKIIAGDWRNLPAMIFYLMKNRPRRRPSLAAIN
jgi:hypothetical protein